MCSASLPLVPVCFFVALWLGLIITGASLLALSWLVSQEDTAR
jgi:hypothetical protein